MGRVPVIRATLRDTLLSFKYGTKVLLGLGEKGLLAHNAKTDEQLRLPYPDIINIALTKRSKLANLFKKPDGIVIRYVDKENVEFTANFEIKSVKPNVLEKFATDLNSKKAANANIPNYYNGLKLMYNYGDVKVVGAQHYNHSGVSIGDNVDLIHEPDNPHDEKAVALWVRGTQIGYFQKNQFQRMVHDFRKRGGEVLCRVRSVDKDKIILLLGYYQEADYKYKRELEKGEAFKVVKLIANFNDDMQENIFCCTVGEEVELEFDYDKDKYLAMVGNLSIGYFPKNADYLEDIPNVYISEISESEDGGYAVSVAIFI
jgi:hypothetical protein